ncbi:response regulator transcription factor [Roseicitreum antarcticum]|uniref:Response regulator receiver domain-containing protein n=1 Tax=Roseicitreum antarcticum TaxID=564137 RepID=A0A1H3C675_9RHOB|nr:response regulator transcription factor [Roseicitreum antarcticum]SDX49591.1 Response regulator receiver domain-containing protein [Roseicitreum antarcticum]
MGKRVLVIEDEVNISEALQFILSRDGWDVLTHAEGGDAVDVVGRTVPDVLILDVMLPGRSGFDILRALRGATATAQLPVLMLTAKGQAADRAMAQEVGATLFMTKPFANAEIVAAIRDLARACDAP